MSPVVSNAGMANIDFFMIFLNPPFNVLLLLFISIRPYTAAKALIVPPS
jgi:hypothetical protein